MDFVTFTLARLETTPFHSLCQTKLSVVLYSRGVTQKANKCISKNVKVPLCLS